MRPFDTLTADTRMQLHLAQARAYFHEDRLDLAAAAMEGALRAGLPAGDYYDLQRTIEAELSARLAGGIIRVAEHLAVEADPAWWGEAWPGIVRLAREALVAVTTVLDVHWGKPVLLTLVPRDEWVTFQHARYGYYAERIPWHKACLPPAAVRSPGVLRRAARHEFTHAAVHGLGGDTVPRWLDEGLAVSLEETGLPDEVRRFRRAVAGRPVPTLDEVSGLFESYRVDLGSRDSDLAYGAAGDFVHRLTEMRGLPAWSAVLREVGAGRSLERAFRGAFGEPLRRAEARWRAADR